jgi:short-subunit dehydrogenase
MNKIALITGASQGIGKEFATICARNGYSLILVARSADLLTALQNDLKNNYHSEVKILSLDLSQPDSVDKLYETFKDDMPNVEILVNNAAFGIVSNLQDMIAEDVRGMIELNIAALTKLTYKLLPHMIAKKNGKILNVASTAAFAPGPNMAMYFASKAYVLSLSEALHEECREQGVTVSVLCPGPTATEFGKRSGTSKTSFAKLSKMSASVVADQGYQGLMKGERVIITGTKNKFTAFIMWLVPHFISLRLISREFRRQAKS